MFTHCLKLSSIIKKFGSGSIFCIFASVTCILIGKIGIQIYLNISDSVCNGSKLAEILKCMTTHQLKKKNTLPPSFFYIKKLTNLNKHRMRKYFLTPFQNNISETGWCQQIHPRTVDIYSVCVCALFIYIFI